MTDVATGWWLEDFEAGQVFTSQGRTITEADVTWFAGWSWDANPVHTDAAASAAGRFGGPVAHGVLGLSVAMGLASRLGVFEACSVALLGVDEWRFLAPLRAGDTVRVEVTIESVRRTSEGSTGVLGRRFRLLRVEAGADEAPVVQEGRIGLMVASRDQSRDQLPRQSRDQEEAP